MKPYCNKKPHRGIKIKNYMLPLCARCTGLIIGAIMGTVMRFFFTVPFHIILCGCIPTFLDWSYQEYYNIESNNITRFITGFLAGFCILLLNY